MNIHNRINSICLILANMIAIAGFALPLFLKWKRRPKLRLRLSNSEESLFTNFGFDNSEYKENLSLKIEVENLGKNEADDVELTINEVYCGNVKINIPPTNLYWSYQDEKVTKNLVSDTKTRILGRTKRHCDFIFLLRRYKSSNVEKGVFGSPQSQYLQFAKNGHYKILLSAGLLSYKSSEWLIEFDLDMTKSEKTDIVSNLKCKKNENTRKRIMKDKVMKFLFCGLVISLNVLFVLNLLFDFISSLFFKDPVYMFLFVFLSVIIFSSTLIDSIQACLEGKKFKKLTRIFLSIVFLVFCVPICFYHPKFTVDNLLLGKYSDWIAFIGVLLTIPSVISAYVIEKDKKVTHSKSNQKSENDGKTGDELLGFRIVVERSFSDGKRFRKNENILEVANWLGNMTGDNLWFEMNSWYEENKKQYSNYPLINAKQDNWHGNEEWLRQLNAFAEYLRNTGKLADN